MKRNRRPVPVILFVLIAVCTPALSRADVALDLSAGFDNVVRPDCWIPLMVHLGGTGVSGQGELRISVTSREGTATYSKPLRLHAGPLNERHTISYFNPQSAPLP